jgi:hypothetical protein
MQGITDYVTPQGVRVLQIHYTADPAKRSPEWITEAHKGMSKSMWDKEMEINFSIFLEKPWYPEFRRDFHVATEHLQPQQGRPIVTGWDYGLTPATLFGQTTAKGQLMILAPEVQSTDCGILAHGRVVQMESNTYFPGYQFYHYGDPAGNQRAQTDEKTANEILRSEYKINVLPGPVSFEKRDNAWRKLLTTLTPDGQPMLIIDPRCGLLIDALSGGYHRKEVSGRVLDVPDKNKYSHIIDAGGYMISMVYNVPAPRDKRRGPMPKRGAL